MTPLSAKSPRVLGLLLSGTLALGLAGFFTGTRVAPEPSGYRSAAPELTDALARAPRQREFASVRYRERGIAQESALAALAEPSRTLETPVALDPRAYAQAIEERARGRAYDGAPPTIPHAVDQQGAPACLACHAEGMKVDGRVASPLSHEPFSSCLQCHATREAPLSGAALLDPGEPHVAAERSTFAGLRSSGRGPRASVAAPPQMPHRSFMRERCASCHGLWASGLASSHPWRQSCTQCHTPAADEDQLPRSVREPLPPFAEAP